MKSCPLTRIRARIGEQRRRHRRRGVHVVLRRGVVEIVDVRTDAVHQRGVQRVETFRAPEHRGGGGTGVRAERAER